MNGAGEAFAERAAILQFDHGLTRWKAETEAARRLGMTRWQAMEAELGHMAGATGTRDHGQGDNRHAAGDLPAMLAAEAEQDRPVLVGDIPAGRDRGVLPPLRLGDGAEA